MSESIRVVGRQIDRTFAEQPLRPLAGSDSHSYKMASAGLKNLRRR